MKDKLVMVGAIILVLQGFFPETFQWPTNSQGWIRFFLGLLGACIATVTNADWGGNLRDPRKENQNG